MFSNCKSNMRKSWHTIKHLLGQQINHSKFKEIVNNDETGSDKSQTASGLNEYFPAIGRELG